MKINEKSPRDALKQAYLMKHAASNADKNNEPFRLFDTNVS